MPADEVRELQILDAVASEQGSVLAFRVSPEDDGIEPVFMRVFKANPETERETALVSIEDANGMSLGSYMIPRDRLDKALAEAPDVDAEPDDESAPESLWA